MGGLREEAREFFILTQGWIWGQGGRLECPISFELSYEIAGSAHYVTYSNFEEPIIRIFQKNLN
jgi:hypothetical protein